MSASEMAQGGQNGVEKVPHPPENGVRMSQTSVQNQNDDEDLCSNTSGFELFRPSLTTLLWLKYNNAIFDRYRGFR
ncbi:hypothetical protein CKO18_10130 [Rhodoferax fermentans]|nr:hypothetical protein [Rhodoferax fermentans]